jgi:subtilisin-like proprotein convertase family protein
MRRILLLLATMSLAVLLASGVALAVTTTFTNKHRITIPDEGNATPFPSTIQVSGFPEGSTITDVNLTLTRYSHTYPADVAMLLEHNGITVELPSPGTSANVKNITLVLDDDAATQLPQGIGDPLPSGTYDADALTAFNGLDPNGTWNFSVVDLISPDKGKIGAWSLEITN